MTELVVRMIGPVVGMAELLRDECRGVRDEVSVAKQTSKAKRKITPTIEDKEEARGVGGAEVYGGGGGAGFAGQQAAGRFGEL